MIIRAIHGLAGLVILITGLVFGCSEPAGQSPPVEPSSTPAKSAGDADSLEQLFDSPEKATQSLVSALRSYDRDALAEIFGANAGDLISSGDEVADRSGIDDFLTQYDARHELTASPDGSMVLVVGETDWPLPIPLVKESASGLWYFDTEAGMDEMINRRIGRNELTTIQVCLAIVDAQREYAFEDPDGDGVRNYAQKLRSDPGQKNGLYWETAEGEPPSPMGSLVARATAEGYTPGQRDAEGSQPYHGYRYRLLTSQGPSARGGAMEYMVNGKLIGGFAVVAFPAEYGASGIMTFMVNHDGIVYQCDLGEETDKTVAELRVFDPTPQWHKVEPAVLKTP